MTEDKLRRRRDLYYQRKYGITLDQYEAMFEAQGGVCAMCGRPPGKRQLDVDHSHQTGEVRGLLCPYCNHRVISRHTLEKLRQAVDYLERHEQRVQEQAANIRPDSS